MYKFEKTKYIKKLFIFTLAFCFLLAPVAYSRTKKISKSEIDENERLLRLNCGTEMLTLCRDYKKNLEETKKCLISKRSNIKSRCSEEINKLLNFEDAGWHWIYDDLKFITPENWSSLLTKYKITSFDIALSCKRQKRKGRTAINFLNTDRAKLFTNKKTNVSLGHPRNPCFRKGDKIQLISFDYSPERPLIEVVGEAKIGSIVNQSAGGMPDGFLQELGLSKDEYLNYFKQQEFYNPNNDRDTILYLENITKVAPVQTPPMSFPYTIIYRPDEIVKNIKAPNKLKLETGNFLIIDVRSKQEYQYAHIPRSINMPVDVRSLRSIKFNNKILNKHVSKNAFDVKRLPNLKNIKRIIIVAADENDVRAIIALKTLAQNEQYNLGWLYSGINYLITSKEFVKHLERGTGKK